MRTQVLNTLDNSRNYTLAVANAMNDKLYETKPIEEVWNFGELLNHIGYGIRWWESNYIRKEKMKWDPPALPTSKVAVLKWLEDSFEILKRTVSNMELTTDAINGFHATLDHITHHRGQAILYLRMKQIAAPEYIY